MTEVAFSKPDNDIVAELPVQPVGWRVLVRPYEVAEQSSGGILYVDETKESEDLLSYVGQIVAMGDLCYRAVTRSGINLADINPRPKVGDWVMYGTYGGQSIKTKTGAKYIIMNDDGIMGIVPDPAAFRVYI
jgi:co-chaperonin GroES (HSP10)